MFSLLFVYLFVNRIAHKLRSTGDLLLVKDH